KGEGNSGIREWGGRKMHRTPWPSMAQDVGDCRVFWLGFSGCPPRAWISFLPIFQPVSSIYKTRNQLYLKASIGVRPARHQSQLRLPRLYCNADDGTRDARPGTDGAYHCQ